MSKASSLHSGTLLCPPDGWAAVEGGSIFRCASISKADLTFLRLTGIRCVVNMSTHPLALAAANGMIVFQPCAGLDHASNEDQRSQFSDEIAKDALEMILNKELYPLVLTGSRSSSGLEVAALVGCLRRVQNWALTSILFEFRLFAPSAPVYDVNRQFLERFDTSLVSIPRDPPSWLDQEFGVDEEFECDDGRDGDGDEDRFQYYSKGHVPLLSDKITFADLGFTKKGKDDDD